MFVSKSTDIITFEKSFKKTNFTDILSGTGRLSVTGIKKLKVQ